MDFFEPAQSPHTQLSAQQAGHALNDFLHGKVLFSSPHPMCKTCRLDRRLSGIAVSDDIHHALDAQRVKLAGAVVPANLDPAVQKALRQAINQSFVSGFRAVMLISVALAVLSALVGWLLIRGTSVAPT